MCTAVYYKNRYFGRNLDYHCSFGEEVVLVPLGFSFFFGEGKEMQTHHAIIGMAYISEGVPLFYDGMNEKGLAMAGLLFEGNGVYQKPMERKDNVPSWGFIPWILGQCETVFEAEKLLENLNLTDTPFSEALPPSHLHWMIADRERCIVVEPLADGLHIHENSVGVLTNNPPFPFQMENLNQYLNLTAEEPQNRFSETFELKPFSRGMGAMGLPGDWSSVSRFVRAVFVLSHAVSEGEEDVPQCFHILGAVEQIRGCVEVEKDKFETTIYTSFCDLKEGVYYWKTYENPSLKKVGFIAETLDITGLQRLQIGEK